MYQKQLHSRDGFLAVLLSCTPDVYMVHEQSVRSLEINLNSFPFLGGAIFRCDSFARSSRLEEKKGVSFQDLS